MAPAQSKPSLLTLPQELRDMIYEYTFTQIVKLPGEDHLFEDDGTERVLIRPRSVRETNAGITLVSKQTHVEAIRLYYDHTILFTHTARLLCTWLRRTKVPSDLISRINTIRICHRTRRARVSPISPLGFAALNLSEMYDECRPIEPGVVKVYTGSDNLEDTQMRRDEESFKSDSSQELWTTLSREIIDEWKDWKA